MSADILPFRDYARSPVAIPDPAPIIMDPDIARAAKVLAGILQAWRAHPSLNMYSIAQQMIDAYEAKPRAPF